MSSIDSNTTGLKDRTDRELVLSAASGYLAVIAQDPVAAAGAPLPDVQNSTVVEHDGKRYVLLRAVGGGTAAIYRVQNDGVLRRMKRPPAEVRALM